MLLIITSTIFKGIIVLTFMLEVLDHPKYH